MQSAGDFAGFIRCVAEADRLHALATGTRPVELAAMTYEWRMFLAERYLAGDIPESHAEVAMKDINSDLSQQIRRRYANIIENRRQDRTSPPITASTTRQVM